MTALEKNILKKKKNVFTFTPKPVTDLFSSENGVHIEQP